MRLTKQGVRDLNPPAYNGRRTKGEPEVECAHVWEDDVGYDCETLRSYWYQRCGFCKETR